MEQWLNRYRSTSTREYMIGRNGATLAGTMLGLVALSALSGQESTAPTFEVASVKRNNTSEPGRQGALFRENINTTDGSVTLRNVTLNSCIKWAYGLQDPQISGPDWITVERYDIVAKSSAPTSEGQLRLMLRTLLADRFKLVVHSEIKSLSVIALTVGKNRPKLRESEITGAGACGRAGAVLSPKARLWRSWLPLSPIHCGRQS